jgi:hypothetical protein
MKNTLPLGIGFMVVRYMDPKGVGKTGYSAWFADRDPSH